MEKQVISEFSIDCNIPISFEHLNNNITETPNAEQKSLNSSYKKPKRSWQNSYLTTFLWLRYDITNQVAFCSFKNCNMYHSNPLSLFYFINIYKLLANLLENGKENLPKGKWNNMNQHSLIKLK